MKTASNIISINAKGFTSSIKGKRLSTGRLAKWELWQRPTEPRELNFQPRTPPLRKPLQGAQEMGRQTSPVSLTHLLLSDGGEEASPGQEGQISGSNSLATVRTVIAWIRIWADHG